MNQPNSQTPAVENAAHSDALQRFLTITCPQCWDSFVGKGMFGPTWCARCLSSRTDKPAAAMKIYSTVVRLVDAGKPIDNQLLDAARSLANATAENPVPGEILEAHLRCDRRRLSQLMKRLRDEWKLPAIASRKPPYGHFIAITAEQLLEWNRVTRSQAISELATSYSLVKANYPLLTGQQQFDFLALVTTELQEAIR